MLKNSCGFIPARYRQPYSYRKIGRNWNAIYRHPTTKQEYHIQMVAWHLSINDDCAESLQVLRQDKDCRRRIGGSHKTIKSAVAALEQVFAAPVGQDDQQSA